MNLYEKIQAVSNEIKNVEKNLEVGNMKYGGYKGVADMDVLREVKKAEKKYKLISIPTKQEIIQTEHIQVINKKGEEVVHYIDTIKMTLRIIDLEEPSSFIETESLAKGIDASDKGLGKASTYARKYALLNAYKLITGEDLDENQSEEVTLKIKDKVLLVVNNTDQDRQAAILKHFGKNEIKDLTEKELNSVLGVLKKEGLVNV